MNSQLGDTPDATPTNMGDGPHNFDVERGRDHSGARPLMPSKLRQKFNAFGQSHIAPPKPPGFANPAPLGLMGFGMTTLMLMYVEAEWVEPGFAQVVVCYALFFGGAAQLLAGMWEMARGNTFAATAFSSYGAFWLGFAILRVLASQSTNGGFAWGPDSDGYAKAEALFMGQWGVMSTLFWLLTLRKGMALQIVFFTVSLAFFLLAGGQSNAQCKVAGGYVGLLCAATAVYLSIGEMMLETYNMRWPGV